jgi:hypothetical protein
MSISLEIGSVSFNLSDRAYLSLISNIITAPSLPADIRYLSSPVIHIFYTPPASWAWNYYIWAVEGNL